jgi:lysophospholipid acyltransferase (LPLAT)-like uncharacterized protein
LLLQNIAGLLAGFIYKIYASTFRYSFIFEDESDKNAFFEDIGRRDPHDGNMLYACFHQDDVTLLAYFIGMNFCILISNSKDGQILASGVEYMGFQTVRGSSHRGAVAGLLAGMKKVKEGHKFVIAVDGPRGPIYKVKDGVTALAKKFEKPIVPIRGFPKRKIVFQKSWNKATLPLPFSQVNIVIGKIKEYSTQELEEKLLSLSRLNSY